MTGDDYKELSDATYVALLELKTAKWEVKRTRTLKARFLDGHPFPIPYTDRELKTMKLVAESNFRKCQMLFTALWKSRRRAQKESKLQK